jgi:hypothetical protein
VVSIETCEIKDSETSPDHTWSHSGRTYRRCSIKET